MSQGLQVYNAIGNLILDIGSRPIKILTSTTIIAGTNANISIPSVTGNVVPVALLPENLKSPKYTISTNNVAVTWEGDYGTGSAPLYIMEF